MDTSLGVEFEMKDSSEYFYPFGWRTHLYSGGNAFVEKSRAEFALKCLDISLQYIFIYF